MFNHTDNNTIETKIEKIFTKITDKLSPKKQ